ncbi:hypothetical protein JW698_00760 [Candidatus Wolfebacteria bacterium]|nr:hypothetical protein [Candidatus Wolfebacteria bacterium]
MSFIKVVIFLIIIGGIAMYFLSHQAEFFQFSPQEKITDSVKEYTAPSLQPASSPSTYSPSDSTTISSPSYEIPDYLIPSNYTRDQLSPYFQKINISSVTASSFYSIYPTQLRIYSNLSKDEKVNITGWKIKSNKGEFNIPQAVNVYEPSGLITPSDIIISGNSSILILEGKSPIKKSFRLNKCIGYLANTYDFNPSLPQNCPSISRSEIVHLSGQCQSYINSLWGCKVPEISFYNSLPGTDEGNACRAFLSTINHGSCFQKYHLDSDFLLNEWRLWVDRIKLDSQHDRLLIFDEKGLLVDEYIY